MNSTPDTGARTLLCAHLARRWWKATVFLELEHSSRKRHSGITAIASKCSSGVLHEDGRFVSFGRFPMEECLAAGADQLDYMAS